LNCSTSSKACTSCATSPNRANTTTCACSDHYYETGSACAICNYKCGNCTTNATNCTTCSDTNRSPTPTCGCNATFYDDGTATC